ncbi:QRFP-like peptide receptor [Gigantopelta aegis]|uniref:QRFP-like peptide receptor n=1 Tax=Gigantopelta aegis TaxID=1735272 RepID=UPI001B887E65|nr:QRFP-like peptide receptor [Gigantopelta aegis]
MSWNPYESIQNVYYNFYVILPSIISSMAMDQHQEYTSYKNILEIRKNDVSPFNFSGADDILREFETNLYSSLNYRSLILLSLYAPVFVVALLGNILIICAVAGEKTLRKARNYFLINLAACDLCVTLVCMPIAVGTITYKLWIYGDFLCKTTSFLQGIAVSTGIFTLTAMSIDRFLAIQRPVTNHKITTPGQALVIIIVTWVVSAIFMGPFFYIKKLDTLQFTSLQPVDFCIEDWPRDYDRKAFGVFLLFANYIIPAITLTACYAHIGKKLWSNDIYRQSSDSSTTRLCSRKKAARMLIILVIIFMVCWLPYQITSLCIDLEEDSEPVALLPFAIWLGHAHSAINPVMLWVLNRQFRQKIRAMLRKLRRRNDYFDHPDPRYV